MWKKSGVTPSGFAGWHVPSAIHTHSVTNGNSEAAIVTQVVSLHITGPVLQSDLQPKTV